MAFRWLDCSFAHTSVDEDIVTAQLEERGHVLKDKREGVCLPVVGVVGEQNLALDI